MSIQDNNEMLVKDVMLPLGKFPVIAKRTIFKVALEEMNHFKLGVACIVDENNQLLGLVTDGDIRRKLLKVQKPFAALLNDDALNHSVKSPQFIKALDTLVHAVSVMGDKQVWDLPVLDEEGVLKGLLHLHPAVKALLEMDG